MNNTISKKKLKAIVRRHIEDGGVVRFSNWQWVRELTEPEDAEWCTKQSSKSDSGLAITFVAWRIYDRAKNEYVTPQLRYRWEVEGTLQRLDNKSRYVALEWNDVYGYRNVWIDGVPSIQWVPPTEE